MAVMAAAGAHHHCHRHSPPDLPGRPCRRCPAPTSTSVVSFSCRWMGGSCGCSRNGRCDGGRRLTAGRSPEGRPGKGGDKRVSRYGVRPRRIREMHGRRSWLLACCWHVAGWPGAVGHGVGQGPWHGSDCSVQHRCQRLVRVSQVAWAVTGRRSPTTERVAIASTTWPCGPQPTGPVLLPRSILAKRTGVNS